MQSRDETKRTALEIIGDMSTEKVFILTSGFAVVTLILSLTFYNLLAPDTDPVHAQIMKCLNGTSELRNSSICQEIVSHQYDVQFEAPTQ